MVFIDQTNHQITLETTPKRVVSLVPSQTELLYYLGIKPIAQTIFCVHPKDKFKTSVKIGGTKKPHLEKIISLKPEIIIGNKEENNKEDILFLRQYFPVWLSDIRTLEDSLAMIKSLGEIFQKDAVATKLFEDISNGFSEIWKKDECTYLYLIWKNPFMAAGTNTFISNILSKLGLKNCLEGRYPQLNISEIQSLNPDLVFLSSEPYPFKEKDITEIKLALPDARIKFIDGEMCSWYGSRLLHTPNYLKHLLE